jgi:MFS family permease
MAAQNPYELLRIKDYRNFLSSRFLLFVGLEIQFIVIGWVLYDMTKDPLTLGIVGLCEALPALLITPFGGHFADRHDRRTIIKWAFTIAFLSTIVLVISAWNLHTLGRDLAISIIYSVIVVQGCARGFAGPAIMALVVQLVPRERIPQSTAFNSSTWQLGTIAGPALGGLIFGLTNAQTAFLFATVILAVSLFLLLQVPSYPMPDRDERERFKTSFFEGWRFVRRNQLVLAPIAMDMFAVLFGGAVALLPVFASDILKVGPMGLGILRTAPSLGALSLGFYLAHHPMKGKMGTKLLWAVVGFGGSIIIFALSENVVLSFGMLMLSGAFDNISVIIRAQIVQLVTPEGMRGRVSAVDSMFIISSNEIGAFESGFAAKLMGTVPSVIFGGVMTMVTVGLTAVLAPRFRRARFEELKELKKEAA